MLDDYASPIGPWKVVPNGHLGGITDVGFSRCSRYLLLQSHSGLGVIDCATGRRVARDVSVEYSYLEDVPEPRFCRGIGPIENEEVPVEGLFGSSSLPKQTDDGWRMTSRPAEEEGIGDMVVLHAPGDAAAVPLHSPYSVLRGFGFSPDRRVLVVVTASEVVIRRRDIKAEKG